MLFACLKGGLAFGERSGGNGPLHWGQAAVAPARQDPDCIEDSSITAHERNSGMRTHCLAFGFTFFMLTGTVGAADTTTHHVHCKGGGTFAEGFPLIAEARVDAKNERFSFAFP